LWLSFATFLLLLGYFVYRAHNWARRIVIGLCLCLGAFFVYGCSAAEVSWARGMSLARVIEHALDHVGLYLCSLTPVAFIIGVLCHRDVAASFRSSMPERSNQAMEPTAGSFDS
jgi:hypothetical protein